MCEWCCEPVEDEEACEFVCLRTVKITNVIVLVGVLLGAVTVQGAGERSMHGKVASREGVSPALTVRCSHIRSTYQQSAALGGEASDAERGRGSGRRKQSYKGRWVSGMILISCTRGMRCIYRKEIVNREQV